MAKKSDMMPVTEHLEALRRVFIVSIISTMVLAVAAYIFSDQIMAVLMEPLTRLGQKVFFTGVTEAIFVKIKISIFAGFLAALPVILWQVWGFIIPALGKKEKMSFSFFVLISSLCFFGGVAFGFFGVYRYGVTFLLQFAGPSLAPMLTIDKYISFTISFLLPFGIIFEFPLVTFFLAKLGLVTYSFFARNRRYAILAAVVISAVITPTPDIITCLIVSGPMYLLFEASIMVVRIVERGTARRKRREEAAEMTGALPQ